jgi:hypothetical protein
MSISQDLKTYVARAVEEIGIIAHECVSRSTLFCSLTSLHDDLIKFAHDLPPQNMFVYDEVRK